MEDTKKESTLKRSVIFSSLNDDELVTLAGFAIERYFAPHEFVFWEGDAPDWFYIVTEGEVKVFKHSSSGREFIIAFLGPGEMFGEVAVFVNKPYPASAQAIAETKVVGVKREDLLSFLTNNPQVALRIINVLGDRLREAQSRLRYLASERVEQRLASILLMLASKVGLTIPFTRQELADMVGTTTETVIRTITSLKQRNIVSTVRGKVTIVNEEKLRLLSDSPPRVCNSK